MQPIDRAAPGWRAFLPEIAIVVASVLYGATFAMVQDALEHTTPSGFNLIRFTIGAVVLAPIAIARGWRGPHPRPGDSARTLVVGGAAIGVVAWIAYLTQNIGLERTTTSNSAFITGLFAVVTPFVEVAVYRRWPRGTTLIAVPISMFGLFLLTGAQLGGLNSGDAVTLLTALFFGIWFVQISEYAPRLDIISLVCLELATIAILSAPVVAVEGIGTVDGQVIAAAGFTGIACSAFAFCLSSWAQRRVDPSRASLITLLEPVVAGFVGYTIGERLGVGGYVGAVLILAAIVVAESGSWRAEHAHPEAALPSESP